MEFVHMMKPDPSSVPEVIPNMKVLKADDLRRRPYKVENLDVDQRKVFFQLDREFE